MKQTVLNRIMKVLLAFVIVFVIFLVLFLIGALIGYSVIGGGNPLHLLTPTFWQTLFGFL